jgi:hypothetical protein
MMEVKLTSKSRLVVESFNGRSRHGAFPGIRIRLAGKRTAKTLVTMHASRALELADALQSVFGSLSKGDDFFQSPAWLRLRYEILKKHHGRCQACGRSANDGVIIQVDHIKPRSKYPKLALDPEHMSVLCQPCNVARSNSDQTDWREKG